MKTLMVSSKRLRAGFTLVELVVTVAVIGILLTIITIASVKLQQQSRDSEREGDVMAIMSALEKYYDKNGEYPANDEMNPTNSPTNLPSLSQTKTLLPTLTDNDLTGPGDYQFYASCVNTVCSNTSTNWRQYHAKQYYYVSRFLTQTQNGGNSWVDTGITYGSGTGWGCRVLTTYADPGFALAWRREQDGIWVFKRSIHGNVTIGPSTEGVPAVAPQECRFS